MSVKKVCVYSKTATATSYLCHVSQGEGNGAHSGPLD